MRIARCALALAAAFTLSSPVLAQGAAPSTKRADPSGYRAFAATIPFNFSRELNGRLEMNLAGKASLAIEGGGMRRGFDTDEKEFAETGESVESRGRGGMLMVSRYQDGMSMGGFFWGLGVGYREMDARWTTDATSEDPDLDRTLVDYSLRPQTGSLHHDATLKGTTGTMRAGYRYVAEEYPLSIGGFIGFRHFQAGVKDAEMRPGDSDRWGEAGGSYAQMTDRERDRLRRRYTTKFEPGIEFGFSF